ncbi:hypothetical protein [Flavobacterium kingsejongi]|uniref:Uncharacterized protein n=1 Tax=Flavobacterium kingsejongi TaxID=1678728 RepID=A0A2S1LP89_9FLAO|nr:hypothetical protein [Flavobacterium kingsejongi]AWG25518.1 hypothetical protein FK004_09855 [Flavobacterium kingsejongi]
MRPETIYDLLEINTPEKESPQQLLARPKQNIVKHLLLRIFYPIAFVLLICAYWEWEGTNDSLAFLLLIAVVFLAVMLFLLIEAIVLHIQKKYILRNTNLAILLLAILVSTVIISQA